MPVTTFHRYIDQYPILPESTKLIIGTIHPHRVVNFNIDFFYGNMGSFWDILSLSFPNHQFGNRHQILTTFRNYGVSITDIIRQCDRENEYVTEDSKLYNLIDNGVQIQEGLIHSNINTIYFTSRFGVNNAAKLFVERFGIKYTDTFNQQTSQFMIKSNVFGREIRAVVLYSPSNNANRGIARSAPYLNNIDRYQHFEAPIKQFKIEFYRDKFGFFNE
ncbi:MAG: hypothetical protein WCL21_14615 [Mariniphaga sp.]